MTDADVTNAWGFASSLLNSLLSWPIVVLVIFLMIKGPIRELIPKLRQYEGMGQRVTFGDQLADAEETVETAVGAIEPSEGQATLEQPRLLLREEDPLLREAQTNPSFVVISAWEQLDGALRDLVGSVRGPWTVAGDTLDKLQLLRWNGSLSVDFIQAVRELHNLRNRVAHGQHAPTPGEAVAYAETARALRRGAEIITFRNQLPNDG